MADHTAQLAALGVLYGAALALSLWRRTSALADALAVLLIFGLGATGIVHLLTLPLPAAPAPPPIAPGRLVAVGAYLVLLALILTVAFPRPHHQRQGFLRRQALLTGYKLLLFVLIPLAALRWLWQVEWSALGLTLGDVPAQLGIASVLILLLGGLNLLLGSAAAPIRARRYPAGRVAAAFGVALAWNVVEVGLVEEFFFRGVLQGHLTAWLGSPVVGILCASLLFGLAHVPGLYVRAAGATGTKGERTSFLDTLLYGILALAPTGWFMGLLCWRTRSLLAPVLVHAAVDAVAHTARYIEGLGLAERGAGAAS